MKRLFLMVLVGVGLVFGGWYWMGNRVESGVEDADKLTVVTSFYPLAEYATQVGGERVMVRTLTPAGAEPHDFEPTPQDMALIASADMFVYNGAGFEPWVERVLEQVSENGVVVNASDGIELLNGYEDEHEEDEHGDEDAHDEELGYDPHVWLDPVLAKRQVTAIAEGLARADSANAVEYRANAEAYNLQLDALDREFRDGLAMCARRTLVTAHNAFGYLGARYTIDILSVSGLSPDQEPSPRQLASVADFARENEVKYIFFETLVEPRLAETIANEVGAATLVLNPLEGLTEDEIAGGQDYLSVQRSNLANMRIALECQ